MREHGLSELAAGEIAELRDRGVTLTDEDIVNINDAAREVESPTIRRQLSRGNPIECGGVLLWPLTLQAYDWNERVGCRMRSETLRRYAVAYAMAHGRSDSDALLVEGKQAERAVKEWSSKLTCTDGELMIAVAQVLQQEDGPELPPSENEGKGMSIADFALKLNALAGETPEFWERRVSFAYARQLMTTIIAQQAGENGKNIDNPAIDAERALGWVIKKIERRHHGQA